MRNAARHGEITVTISDGSLPAVERPSRPAASRCLGVAEAADARPARAAVRFRAALAANAAAGEHHDAVQFAWANGRKTVHAAAQLEEPAGGEIWTSPPATTAVSSVL
jgi:hypothetical protein